MDWHDLVKTNISKNECKMNRVLRHYSCSYLILISNIQTASQHKLRSIMMMASGNPIISTYAVWMKPSLVKFQRCLHNQYLTLGIYYWFKGYYVRLFKNVSFSSHNFPKINFVSTERPKNMFIKVPWTSLKLFMLMHNHIFQVLHLSFILLLAMLSFVFDA